MKNTVNPMELTDVEKASVSSLIGDLKKVDNSSNKVFATCKAYFERNANSKTKAIRTGLTKAMNHLIIDEESHIKKRVTDVVSTAGDFIGYKLDETDLYYNRIKEIVTLMKFFEADEDNKLLNNFKEIREKFNEVLGNPNSLGKREYNEGITELIEAIKKANKIEDGEELVFKGSKEQLIAMIKSQFADDLEEIAKALLK